MYIFFNKFIIASKYFKLLFLYMIFDFLLLSTILSIREPFPNIEAYSSALSDYKRIFSGTNA